MKLIGHVIEATNCGDSIRVAIQAPIGKANWMPMEKQVFQIADTRPNSRAFHLGRKVEITITPK
jgi:hypothetical protein